MLKKLQALKAKKGFTLVELIVVIAIIAVLAAILVPTLLNQVTNSRITSADATASTIRDTINAWIVEQNAQNGTLVNNTSDDEGIKGTGSTFSIDGKSLSTVLANAYDFKSTDSYRVIIADHKVKAVAYCATGDPLVKWNGTEWSDGGVVGNQIIGTYPKKVKS